ncbi:MAG: PadR family transcriptional regulator [Catonella sp.]|jgi:PadR family transcriptional regulator PadR|nr:PadR family transcriptional regulator [Catonella sp.]MDY6357061.1 PadR family transcriptional regulator [Catonella sp.]
MAEISSSIIRGYIDIMILFILKDGDSYAYEIGKRINEITEQKYIIKETTLYSAFTRMEKNHFADPYIKYSDSGKKRTYYSITPAGREWYETKCEEWNLTKDIIDRFTH